MIERTRPSTKKNFDLNLLDLCKREPLSTLDVELVTAPRLR